MLHALANCYQLISIQITFRADAQAGILEIISFLPLQLRVCKLTFDFRHLQSYCVDGDMLALATKLDWTALEQRIAHCRSLNSMVITSLPRPFLALCGNMTDPLADADYLDARDEILGKVSSDLRVIFTFI